MPRFKRKSFSRKRNFGNRSKRSRFARGNGRRRASGSRMGGSRRSKYGGALRRVVRKFVRRRRGASFKKRVRTAAFDHVPWITTHRTTGWNIIATSTTDNDRQFTLEDSSFATYNGRLLAADDITAIANFIGGQYIGVAGVATGTSNIPFHVKCKMVDTLVNRGSTAVFVTAYPVLWRKSVYTNSADGVFTQTSDAEHPALAFKAGFEQQQTDSGNVFYSNPGVTPYENRYFCQHFKIGKPKKFSLLTGHFKRLTLKSKPRRLNGLYDGTGPETATIAERVAVRGVTRTWLYVVHSIPIAAQGTAITNVSVGPVHVIATSHEVYKFKMIQGTRAPITVPFSDYNRIGNTLGAATGSTHNIGTAQVDAITGGSALILLT